MNNMPQNLLSAKSLTGDTVKNMKNEDIGKIEELMIDTASGSVSYAVLSFGGFMGLGDKFFAIPWKALDIDKTAEVIRLDIDKKKLENSPGFDKNEWPDFADNTFLHTVNTNYSGIGKYSYRAN